MYEIDHVLVIGITTCMSMSMTTGRSHRSCLYLLYDLRVIEQTPCNYFTLLLTGSHSSRSNKLARQLHGATKMEIKRSKMILAISCHYLIACDVYHVYASYLLRTTVVNKMIPH